MLTPKSVQDPLRKLDPGREKRRVGRHAALAATVLLRPTLGVHIDKRIGCSILRDSC